MAPISAAEGTVNLGLKLVGVPSLPLADVPLVGVGDEDMASVLETERVCCGEAEAVSRKIDDMVKTATFLREYLKPINVAMMSLDRSMARRESQRSAEHTSTNRIGT